MSPRHGRLMAWIAHGTRIDMRGLTSTALSPARHWPRYYGVQAVAAVVAAAVTAFLGSVGFGTIMNQVGLDTGETSADLWVYVAPWAFVFATLFVARIVTIWARGQLRYHQALWLATIAQRLHHEFDIDLAVLNRALVAVPLIKHPKSPYVLQDRFTFAHGEQATIRVEVPVLADELMSLLVLDKGEWKQPPIRSKDPS